MCKEGLVLYFSVAKGTDYVYLTSDGRCLQRRDRDSIPMASERIRFSRVETNSREYDRAFVDNATIADLDLQLVGHVSDRISRGMSVEKCLQHLELAEFDGQRLRLRRAALLLFARNPARWHPRLRVRVLTIDGSEIRSGERYNVVRDEEVTDNVLNLIESSWDLLRPHLTETRFSKDAVFRTQIIYPELACREALINAIAHRDYSNEGRGVEVRVYSDRMEIVSPGELLSSVSVGDLKQLKGVHQSRNSLLARVCRELGYMRELGEGIRRIYELMQSNDLTAPELDSSNNQFTITLSHKYIFTPEEKLWLENFSRYNLSRDQRTIVRLGYGERMISPKQIWDAVGVVDTDYYRQLVESLRKLNILYRKVDRGRAYKLATQRNIPKKAVPQFAIKIPPESTSVEERAQQTAIGTQDQIDNSDYTRIYIGNIPYDITESELGSIFERFGEIADIIIPRNHFSGKIKGFAFIEFDDSESAAKAMERSGSIVTKGRRLTIGKAVEDPRESKVSIPETEKSHISRHAESASSSKLGEERKVFIANIHFSATRDDIAAVFERYGEVQDVYIPRDHFTGRQRSFGFVTFGDVGAARNALMDSGSLSVLGRSIYVQEYVAGR